MDLRQILIAGFIAFQKCFKQFDFRIDQLHPMYHDAGLESEQLISNFNLGNQILQFCPGIKKVVAPQLGFVLVCRIDAIPSFHVLIYSRRNCRESLIDVKRISFGEIYALLNRVDLKFTRSCEELSLGC